MERGTAIPAERAALPIQMETLGVYISVPFCRSKCSFCNFASGVFPTYTIRPYVDRLCEDIRGVRSRMDKLGVLAPASVNSIYLGGGTPSILTPDLLRVLFQALNAEFRLAPPVEITAECAPGQLKDDTLAAMIEVGVNRISFGVQSFVNREAAAAGRLHTSAVALGDIDRVRSAGIENINVDLIAGLPLQTAASWSESLGLLADTGLPHASVYMFEVDEDSRLGAEVLRGGGRYHAGAVPDDDAIVDFYMEAVSCLAARGLEQYEISNFARPGAQSLHNSKYWRREPYLGFGLDAHSTLHSPSGDLRFSQTDNLDGYLRGDVPTGYHRLTRTEMLEETWFLGLRLNEGVDLRSIQAEFGSAAGMEDIVGELATDGLLHIDGGRVRLTGRGRLLSNEVFERFLVGSNAAEPEFIEVL